MFLAVVEGTVVATVKHNSFKGQKLLIGRRREPDGKYSVEPFLFFDTVGAGLGDIVLITTDGELTRRFTADNTTPSRNTAVGIVGKQ